MRAAPVGNALGVGTERLGTYRRKRDFARTPEPSGGQTPSPGPLRFVVQRHRARRLHYDLRFEMDGVLASWAVPRGPTLDPAARRNAVHVEDHPIEYLDFEGVIPAGQYGGGDVIVWDIGTWEPVKTDDPVAAVRAGELHAEVYGQKLRGRLVLIRRDREPGDREQWLLLHKRDDHAVTGWDPEEYPLSVLSGRTNDEVKADPDRLWRSDLPAARASVPLKVPTVSPPNPDELAELDALGANGTWAVFGRALRLSNLDKELFPGGVTKRDLVRYAACIAPTVLPYLAGRAMNMHRYPGGAGTKGFWQKQLPDHAPDWVARWDNPEAKEGDSVTYLVVDEPAALVWAANFGALEWHAWTSKTDEPRRPTYALIDLDPGPATSFADILTLARLHRTALDHLQVRAQPKLTGRRGIQIWIPIARGPSFEETRAWVQQLSRAVGGVVPELISWEWTVRDRGGHARLDYTQNAINKTLVAPYSPRPAPHAPVSAPIDWDELDDPDLRPDGVTMADVPRRLAERGDPFRTVLATDQTLPRIS